MGIANDSRIAVGVLQSAVIALYFRDAAGLSAGSDIPRLSPTVAAQDIGESVDLNEANAEWDEWWSDIMRLEEQRQPGKAPAWDEVFPVPSRFPALAALGARFQDDALKYSNERKRESATFAM